MGYPDSVFSPTTKNTGDVVQASHVNDLQTEVTAIETAALTGVWNVPNQPRAFAFGDGVQQSISSSQSTGVRVTFPTVGYNVGAGGGWSTTTNLYTVASGSSGTYLVIASVFMAAGDPEGALGLYTNGALFDRTDVSTGRATYHGNFVVGVNAGTTLHIGLVMNSTVARLTGTGQQRSVRIVKLS